MDKNLFIKSQKNALHLLMAGNCVSQFIPDNLPQIYVIEDVLFPFKKRNKTLIVWAIKTSKINYAGILLNSGMREKGCSHFDNAVRVSFCEQEIITQKYPGDFINAFLRLEQTSKGTLVLVPTLNITYSEQAKYILSRLYPYLDVQNSEVFLISYSQVCDFKDLTSFYWGIKEENVFKSVNAKTVKPRILQSKDVTILKHYDRLDENYIVIKRRKGLKIYFLNHKKTGA